MRLNSRVLCDTTVSRWVSPMIGYFANLARAVVYNRIIETWICKNYDSTHCIRLA